MPGPSPVVRARLKRNLHKQFEALRLALGLSESEFLQRAIQGELDRAGDSHALAPVQPHAVTQPESPAPGEPLASTRLTVRLPAYVRVAAAERAMTRGMRVTPWVAALVQSHVAMTPVLTDDELKTVEVSNRELSAIGRNINQISRALNEAHFETDRVRLERLAELSEKIETTREAIRGLVRSSRNAWGAD